MSSREVRIPHCFHMWKQWGIMIFMRIHDKGNGKLSGRIMGKSADVWMADLWEKFLDKLSSTKSRKDLKKILEKIISRDEKKMISKRIAVMALLKLGKSYREISRILWIAHHTVSAIKKNFFSDANNYKSYREFYDGPKKWSTAAMPEKAFLDRILEDNIFDFLIHPPKRSTGIAGGWDVKEYRKRILKRK